MHRSRLVSLAVATAVVFGACGASTPTAPARSASPAAPASATATEPGSPSGTPEATAAATDAATQAPEATASPTPTPTEAPTADAAAAFKDTMADPLFTASVTFTGTTTLGSAVTPSTGVLDIRKPSSHLTLTTGAGGRALTSEAINVNGTRYVRSYGQWFEAGVAVPENLLTAVTTVDGQVTDTGIETVGGQDLHHLTITPPAALAAALHLTAKGISNVAGGVDAWVEDDGTPVMVRLAAEWDQVVNKKRLHGITSMDLTFATVGEQVAVLAPSRVWTWSTSRKYGYRMGYPADWQYEKSVKKFIDTYWGYDGDVLGVERTKSYGLSLNKIASYVTKNAKALNRKAVKIASNKPGKLGSMRARIVEYSGKLGKTRYWFVMYLAVKGSKLYWLELRTDKKTDATDRALAASFAATFIVR